jgi:hypothetical protein
VGLDTTTHIATIYDHEVIMPLLMIVYNNLTPNIVVIIKLVVIVALGLCVLGCLVSFEKIVVVFLRIELPVFKRTPMPMVPFNPLIWWKEHGRQFQNIEFFMCQLMCV